MPKTENLNKSGKNGEESRFNRKIKK